MPSCAASCCWRRSASWSAGCASGTLRHSLRRVAIGGARHHGRVLEIVHGRRRRGLPLEAGRMPWIWSGAPPEEQRPAEIEKRQQVSKRQNRGARGREHVTDLQLGRIDVIAPWHAEHAENELREKCHVEPEKDQDRGRA